MTLSEKDIKRLKKEREKLIKQERIIYKDENSRLQHEKRAV